MSTKKHFVRASDRDGEFVKAYMRASGYLQKYFEDEAERATNRVKRKRNGEASASDNKVITSDTNSRTTVVINIKK